MTLTPDEMKRLQTVWAAMFDYMAEVCADYLPGEPFYQAFTKAMHPALVFCAVPRKRARGWTPRGPLAESPWSSARATVRPLRSRPRSRRRRC